MTTSVLDRIREPSDLHELDLPQLAELAESVRREIIRTMAANGGHLATNLGTVELSIALHRCFDSPRDKIVWDVGNQCYTHKMLTGRRSRFHTIRKAGGLSGFVHRLESPHDHFTSGHAGTALSCALGLAAARQRLKQDHAVVAVVGDGALTSGLSYEALNNLSALRSQFLLILNDNSFAISPNRGGVASALEQARAKILEGTFFEDLGLPYFGPVDGHDLPLLLRVFEQVREVDHPVVIHVLTRKGKGYRPAEADPERFHGVSPFDPSSGMSLSRSKAPTYSQLFGEEMVRLGEEDDRIIAITAAMTVGTGLRGFAERFPDRLVDVGIAEQHAVTYAAGLAAGGCRPVVAIYSTFLQRSYDQIIHDVCLQGLPVTFVLDRAGIVGADGATHHGTFDLAYLRAVPGMTVLAPRDGQAFRQMLRWAVRQDGPVAIRVPRGAAPEAVVTGPDVPFQAGRAALLREGSDVALLAIGSMVSVALQAADRLLERGVSAAVIDAQSVKPLDAALLCAVARSVEHVYTVEEHVARGGFGSAVLELFAEQGVSTPVSVLGLPDRFLEHGDASALLDDCGLSADRIVEHVMASRSGSGEIFRSPRPMLPSEAKELMRRLGERALPADLAQWVHEYERVGSRDRFLWNWCLEGVRLTRLPCVPPEMHDRNDVTKVLGVMLDVLLDDVADRGGEAGFLDMLLSIPFSTSPADFSALSPEERAYAAVVERLWRAIAERVAQYPRFHEFEPLWRFDYRQLFNTMRYSHMINREPRLLNLAEHDLYLPHNMHMMVSGTMDLMCSPAFDINELGALREILWHAQCMGRIGNLVTTWERELADRDYTSGVFARAVQLGALPIDVLRDGNTLEMKKAIAEADCEAYFLRQWHVHYHRIVRLGRRIRSVSVGELLDGLEKLLRIHLASRGWK